MAEYSSSIDIEADPEEVFDFLVTNEGMTAWMGQHAALDPVVGGDFSVNIAGYAVRGEYIEIDRPRRVVFSWGMAGSRTLPPGASRVSVTLSPTANGTRVELVHSNLPEVEVAGHRAGWTHFLPRLRLAACGHDPGVDDWVPT
jgi:uncharacterized protein YndB with AHSA1/START domain